MRLIIYAVNVHQGGGAVLLNSIIDNIPVHKEALIFADGRMVFGNSISKNIKINCVQPTIFSRLMAERMLSNVATKNDVVLFFGNLPPLCKLLSHTILFLQNRYLIETGPQNELPMGIRIRIYLEKLWLRTYASNINEFVVQTRTMKLGLLGSGLTKNKSILVMPFLDCHQNSLGPEISIEYDFLYVASGEAHKNHRRLIQAWILLAEEGLFPSLCLTIKPESNKDLLNFLNLKKKEFDLKIFNIGNVENAKINIIYKKSNALIFPSLFESFGLPLIEARNLGMGILAGELDFVRDIVDPDETFDPESPLSIARSVKRHLGVDAGHHEIVSPKYFIETIMKLPPPTIGGGNFI